MIRSKVSGKAWASGWIFLVIAAGLPPGWGLALAQPAASRQASSTTPRTVEELRGQISEWIEHPRFAGARWGMLIQTVDGQTLFSRDADRTFMPASNMKLYTTAAALDILGPEARIRTSVWATRRPTRNGLLVGDLVFQGRGDPNLSPRFQEGSPPNYNDLPVASRIPAIEALADQLAARGIRTIRGNLIADDSYLPGDLLGPGWEWDDVQYYYGAEISALSVNDNSVTLRVRPARRVGHAAEVEVLPATGYVRLVNRVETVASGETRIRASRALNSNTIELSGTIARAASPSEVSVAVHDPALFAATLLREALARRQIRLLGRVVRVDLGQRALDPIDEKRWMELAGIDSAPVSELIRVVNKQSQNLHAELLLRVLGRAAVQLPCQEDPFPAEGCEPARPVNRASTPHLPLDEFGQPLPILARGNALRRAFLTRAGIDPMQLSLRDGSGLARQNLVTPAATIRLLAFMENHPHRTVFQESLVIAGVDGTLERRMRDSAATNNFRGKTGTLSYANALSGYLQTRGGHRLLVSLMGNHYVGPGRDVTMVFDQICNLLADYAGELSVSGGAQ
jgi:D-alanyl-D-alanine carboxypeptidase/D-alanyl-D-alanine-endopeptidase (penicillin-binding protein 4)